ncbi:MAG: type IV conjugative transfer system protein TraE, partial [Thermodesulfovibrio sp.]|nr:type IV conjugative transfer system protein TraE [Thermodesulfovibrio sp.]
IVLLLVNSIVTFLLIKSQKVILVPPSISTQVYVGGSDASDDYLKAMARYVATLALNYNPTVARAQFNDFLKLVSSSTFPSYKSAFYDLADKIETGQVSSAYYITQISVNKKEGKIILSGVLNQWTQDKQFITNESRQYIIRYKISDGMFYVIEFKEYKQGD